MTKYQMTLKSDGPSVMGQNIGGVAWTETKPVTLQYGDPIETDNKGHTKDVQIGLNLNKKLKRC